MVTLDKKAYSDLDAHFGKRKFSLCEFYHLVLNIRADSFLFIAIYNNQEHPNRQWDLIGTLADQTNIPPNITGGFYGPVYASDSIYYVDMYKWGRALGCVNLMTNERDFIQGMSINDLFHDTAFYYRTFKSKSYRLRFVR